MSGFGSGSGSGSGSGAESPEAEEFNCLVDHLLSSSSITNTTHWTIHENLHYSTPVVAAITVLFFLVAFFWNLFIIITFFVKHHLLKEPGNLFLLNLAITDFLISVLVILFSAITEIEQEYIFGNSDVVRCNICTTAGISLMLMVQLSIHTIAVLSVDRFIHLVKPLQYNRLMTPCRAVAIIIVIWILSLIIAILPAVGFGQMEFNRNFGACLFRFTGDNADSGIPNFYYTILVVFWDVIPFIILVATNVYTYKFISRFLKHNFTRRSTYQKKDDNAASKDNQKYHHQQRQLVKVFSALFVASIISWSPVIVVVLLIIFIPADALPGEIYTVGWLCYLTNPVFHPILESLFVKELRYQVIRAKRSVRRASSAIYHSSTVLFRSKALDEANQAMELNPERSTTRQIRFFKGRHSTNHQVPNGKTPKDSTSTEASLLEHSMQAKESFSELNPTRQRRITFSDDLPAMDDFRSSNWQTKGPSDDESFAIPEADIPVGNHMQIAIDVHEDSSSSAVEPDSVVVISPD